MKRCTLCRKEKPVTGFSVKNPVTSRTHSRCKLCVNTSRRAAYRKLKPEAKTKVVLGVKESNRLRREENRKRLLEYLVKHPCVDCGEGDPVVLEFDHLRDKKTSVSELIKRTYGWGTILAEIEKCEVRCANCHRRKTVRTHNHWKGRRTCERVGNRPGNCIASE